MNKQKMYAMCMNDEGAKMNLDRGKEYRVIKVKSYLRFGDMFYILEDGLAYASCHFSVTYLK
jgi:hypothetical protein